MCDLPLHVSSEVGHKKDSGELSKHLFFEFDYQYADWVHYGDNTKADGEQPRNLGIQGITHDIDAFSPYEAHLIQENRFLDTYVLATNMQRYRWKMLDKEAFQFNDRQYFGYAYAGPALAFYASWAIKDALKRNYKTLYFVTRDGILLKEIADKMIALQGLDLKTKLLYGSRRVWRAMSTDDEIKRDFTMFYGRFGGISSFEEFAQAAGLGVKQLLDIAPMLAEMSEADFTDPDVRKAAGFILVATEPYMNILRAEEKAKKDRCLAYLSAEMDLTEPFGIVEFWGRGVTQGQLAKLLEEVAGHKVDTPFYYVRSIWGDEQYCPRHRFSELPVDFSFVEPVLACVPQTTVTAYDEVGGKIVPVYEVLEQEGYEALRAGLVDFTTDYCNAEFVDRERLERGVANSTYRYLREKPSDQFVCDVYGEFTDNHGVFSEVRSQAPVLSADDIEGTDLTGLKQLTKALPISLARSGEAARAAYAEKFSKKKLPSPRKDFFPQRSLDRYTKVAPGQKVIAREDLKVHWASSFAKGTKTGAIIPAGSVIEVEDVVWRNTGIPRLKTAQGYISAHRAMVANGNRILRVMTPLKTANTSGKIRPITGEMTSVLDVEETQTDLIRFHTQEGSHELGPNQFILPRGDLDEFVFEAPKRVLVLSKIAAYSSTTFEDRYRTYRVYQAGSCVRILGVAFTPKGTPRLKTARGYITANRTFVRPLREDLHRYLSKPAKSLKLRKPLAVYTSLEFSEGTRSDQVLEKGTEIKPQNLVWTDDGTPRILVKDGYVSAQKSNFRTVFGIAI